MSAEEFWHGDSSLVNAFREADELRQRRMNQESWLQGLYIYNGVAVAITNAFGKRGSKRQDYPKQPYDIFEKSEEEKKADAEKERRKLIEKLNKWKSAWDRKHPTTKE